MKQWTKEDGLALLSQLADETSQLASQGIHSEAHVRWSAKSQRVLRELFGENSATYNTLITIPWFNTTTAVFGGPAHPEESWDPQLGIDRLNREAFQRGLVTASGVLLAAYDELNDADNTSEIYNGKNTPDEASELLKLLNAIDYKMRKLFRASPKDEKEVQNTFENLLLNPFHIS